VEGAAAERCTETQPAVNWGDPRLSDRFWDKVSPCPMSGCWWWLGQIHSGAPRFEGKSVRSIVYRALIGAPPIGPRSMKEKLGRLRPVCGATDCCNPAHFRASHPAAHYSYHKSKKVWISRNYHHHYNRTKWRNLKTKYGLNPEDFLGMLIDQDGRCSLCRGQFSDDRVWWPRVDHNHRTEAVRDLLCDLCNRGLGFFGDRPDLLRAAADYIERHAAKAAK